jgi:DNA-binding MarR family transcriptional regulator
MSHPNHENIKAEYLDTFSEEEIQLIEMTRNQNFQTLKIIKRDGRIDMIESTERIEDRTRIVDILKQHNYQNIEIKQSDGRIVHINRTVKTKVK